MDISNVHTPAQQKPVRRNYATVLIFLIWGVSAFGGGMATSWMLSQISTDQEMIQPTIQGEATVKEYPLLKYSFPELASRQVQPSAITLESKIGDSTLVSSYIFTYLSDGKKISGVINVPNVTNTEEALPVILMLRGFVHEDGYESGAGSQHAALKYAEAGYLTIAPDFLGFGTSDPQPADALEARFIKPANIMDLLATIERSHLQPLIYDNKVIGRMDAHRLGMWGHSNGGQIALSILEITGREIPTVMWAPVTKPFPYSVLFFTDESEDLGKALRWMLAQFEKDYDINDFTIGKRLENIQAKMVLHQGSVDDAVPQSWSDDFYSLLSGKGKRDLIQYYVYPGDNHGLTVNRETILQRDLAFFAENVKEVVRE